MLREKVGLPRGESVDVGRRASEHRASLYRCNPGLSLAALSFRDIYGTARKSRMCALRVDVGAEVLGSTPASRALIPSKGE